MEGKLHWNESWKNKHNEMISFYKSMPEAIKQKMFFKFKDLLGLKIPPAKILDIACGTGIMSIVFAGNSYDVTGVDISFEALKIAKEMADEKGLNVQWQLGDMRTLNYKNEFDYVLLWDVIFGVFADKKEDIKVIECISRALKLKGRCLFEVYNKEFAIAHGIENSMYYDKEKDIFISDKDKGKLYSHQELQDMLEQNKMKIISMEKGWSWKGDPVPPPYRADYIIAEKL